jgi:hypothetical protein
MVSVAMQDLNGSVFDANHSQCIEIANESLGRDLADVHVSGIVE